jgi:hypothetical protein
VMRQTVAAARRGESCLRRASRLNEVPVKVHGAGRLDRRVRLRDTDARCHACAVLQPSCLPPRRLPLTVRQAALHEAGL